MSASTDTCSATDNTQSVRVAITARTQGSPSDTAADVLSNLSDSPTSSVPARATALAWCLTPRLGLHRYHGRARQPRRKSSSDACRARYASVLRLQPAGCPLCKRAPLNGAPPSGSLAAGWLLPASRWDRRVGSRPDQRCRPIAIAPSFTGRQAESVVTEVCACGLSRVENRALMGTQSG